MYQTPSSAMTSGENKQGQTENLLLREDSGMMIIPNKLRKTENTTAIRLIPMTDREGNIYSGLLADGQVSTPYSCLDDSFCTEEVARLWDFNHDVIWLSSILPTDDENKPVQLMNRSPSRLVIGNFVFKMAAERIRTGKGYPTTVPPHWFELDQRGLANNIPSSQLLVQAIVYQLDGVPLERPQAGIFMIPEQAKASFLNNILQKINPSGPLVPGNLVNDVFSPQTGKMLILQRIEDPTKKGPRGKARVTYNLQFGAPVPLSPDVIRSVYKPWSQLLRQMTVNQQIKLLLERFPVDVVDYGLRRSPYARYLPETWDGKQVRNSSSAIQPETQKKEELEKMPNASALSAGLSPLGAPQQGWVAPAAPVSPAPAQWQNPQWVPPTAQVQQQTTQPAQGQNMQQLPVYQAPQRPTGVPVMPAPAEPPPQAPMLTPIAQMVNPAAAQAAPPIDQEALNRFRANFQAQSVTPAGHSG